MLEETPSFTEATLSAVSQDKAGAAEILSAILQLTGGATAAHSRLGACHQDRSHLMPGAHWTDGQLVFAVIPPGVTIYGVPIRRKERASGKFFP